MARGNVDLIKYFCKEIIFRGIRQLILLFNKSTTKIDPFRHSGMKIFDKSGK